MIFLMTLQLAVGLRLSNAPFSSCISRSPPAGSRLYAYQPVSSFPTPESSESFLVLNIKSTAINSPLFRAELKKAAMFRGLNGQYALKKGWLGETTLVAEIKTEGKTQAQTRFLEWVCALTKDMSQRKVQFQGPPIILEIENCQWSSTDSTRTLPRGFQFLEDAPEIMSMKSEKQVEAQNMAGTDESV